MCRHFRCLSKMPVVKYTEIITSKKLKSHNHKQCTSSTRHTLTLRKLVHESNDDVHRWRRRQRRHLSNQHALWLSCIRALVVLGSSRLLCARFSVSAHRLCVSRLCVVAIFQYLLVYLRVSPSSDTQVRVVLLANAPS